MACIGAVRTFASELAGNENTYEIMPKAFAPVAKEYGIGRVAFHIEIKDSIYTPEGANHTQDLFRVEGDIEEEPFIQMDFVTGEKGNLTISMYTCKNHAELTEDEVADLKMVVEIIFFHLGRCRMIGMVKKNSLTDYMTGLPNTGGFLEYAGILEQKNELMKYNAYYFNLKGFGLINRRFGQQETDEIIKRYARMLTEFANGEECIGRLGGDNFVALIRKERTDAFLNLIAKVITYGSIQGKKVPVEIPAVAGVLQIDESLKESSRIISRCSVALNIAKNVAKVPYVFATKEINSKVYRQKQIAARFKEALGNREFVVYYQPKVETDSYSIVGAEALVRWFCEGEMISPGEFVPILEMDGTICELDFYMLEQVCKHIREWLEQDVEPVRVSVNFSRRNLSNPNLAKEINAVLEKYGVNSKYIEIEVTETMDEAEQGMLSHFMSEMQEYNISMAIDDFGTGYSSLNILRSFSVDVLKIDKSFIEEGIQTENDGVVLANIVRMAKELNMDVVTEGVETWGQVEFLHDIDCNVVQGFLFDRPMPRVDFENKIKMKKYDVTKVQDYRER